jgi:hypothetical protein
MARLRRQRVRWQTRLPTASGECRAHISVLRDAPGARISVLPDAPDRHLDAAGHARWSAGIESFPSGLNGISGRSRITPC